MLEPAEFIEDYSDGYCLCLARVMLLALERSAAS
jgi:hypothetical protein